MPGLHGERALFARSPCNPGLLALCNFVVLMPLPWSVTPSHNSSRCPARSPRLAQTALGEPWMASGIQAMDGGQGWQSPAGSGPGWAWIARAHERTSEVCCREQHWLGMDASLPAPRSAEVAVVRQASRRERVAPHGRARPRTKRRTRSTGRSRVQRTPTPESSAELAAHAGQVYPKKATSEVTAPREHGPKTPEQGKEPRIKAKAMRA